MDISPSEFWELSFSELNIKSEGYFLRIDREWEQTRFIASYLHSQLEGKVITPEKLMPLVFDADNSKSKNFKEAEPISKQDVVDFEKKWLRVNRDEPD